MKAIVFGEANMDLLISVSHFSESNQLVIGGSYAHSFGGRGANQAIALSRLGIETHLVGRVGSDIFGKELLLNISQNGVRTEGVMVAEGLTGLAIIAVQERGEIKVLSLVQGINDTVNEEDVKRFGRLLNESKVALFQLAYPAPAIISAARVANAAGVMTILDPAPILSNIPPELFTLIDVITPNRQEAEQIVGFEVRDPETASKAASLMHQRGSRTVIVKLGAQGVFCSTPDDEFFVPAFRVKVVDTVGAGDAFNGGLAAALAHGLSMREAVIWGAAAGALSVTRAGAQSAMPDLKMLMDFLRRNQDQVISEKIE